MVDVPVYRHVDHSGGVGVFVLHTQTGGDIWPHIIVLNALEGGVSLW